jgi:hypothetical protein
MATPIIGGFAAKPTVKEPESRPYFFMDDSLVWRRHTVLPAMMYSF